MEVWRCGGPQSLLDQWSLWSVCVAGQFRIYTCWFWAAIHWGILWVHSEGIGGLQLISQFDIIKLPGQKPLTARINFFFFTYLEAK